MELIVDPRTTVLWILAVLCLIGGCRQPQPVLESRGGAGIIYDTAYEELLKSGQAPALLEEAYGPYVDTLSEPVSVVDWQDGLSTWEVFYATNRGAIAPAATATRMQYGNEVLAEPQFGRAELTLPRRKRGADPQQAAEPATKRFGLPLPSWRKPPDPEEAVQFDSVDALSWSEFAAGVNEQLQASRQQDLLLFVHGFNVDFDSAVIRTAQLALDTPFNGAVVSYCWPTQGGIDNYEEDEPINARSVSPFTQFLEGLLASVPPETRINIVVHSMGNRIVMQSLNQLPRPVGPKRFAEVLLCAPDVGIRDFREWAPGVVAQAERVSLYASMNDSALIASKGLHAERRAGDAHPTLTVPGVETIDCSSIDFGLMGHSYYSNNTDVLSDLFAVLKEHKPADDRWYLSRETDDETGLAYWQFSQHAPRILYTWYTTTTPRRRSGTAVVTTGL